ncbi:MAG: nitrile hydratase subunit beta [OM182 bacterium]|nr:nitrile hydratase subunit beta [OM182 bacterium]
MIGAHDLGGKQGFGRVLQVSNADAQGEDPVEPLFHAEWERRAFALTLATGMLGQWNIDESRHARENQAPQRYLDNSYYETWLVGLQKLLHEKGMLEREELAALPFAASVDISASASKPQRGRPITEAPTPAKAAALLTRGGPTLLPDSRKPKYALGALVKVLPMTQAGHTRAPEYVHGASGIIHAVNGVHIYPDANAHRQDKDRVVGETLYTVSFARAALFPQRASCGDGTKTASVKKTLNSESTNQEDRVIKESCEDRVCVDLWEPYLTHD